MLEHPESLRYSPNGIGSDNADGLGNQQGNGKTLAFLGGLVTGEGCFTIGVNRMSRQSKDRWLRLLPIFSISMNDERTMQVFTNEIEAFGLPTYFKEVTPRSSGKVGLEPRVHWNLQVVGLVRVPQYTELLIPWLYGQKKDAAIVVDRFCRRRKDRHKRGIDEDDLRDIEEIRAINARNGGNKYSIPDLRDYTERRFNQPLPDRKI